MVKETPLSFPKTGENPAQWFQWLQSMDQQDITTGWPLLAPSKVPVQKCEKCSREFCSPINYRRHIRLHRQPLNSDKESRKYRDLLGAFWDKRSEDEVKEVVSLQGIKLQAIEGSSFVTALATVLRKPGISVLPRDYVQAGSELLKVIQAKPSRLPLTSEELFSILDDASERTFLCGGTDDSVQNYVFGGEAAKICFESKNLVACTSFLFEQKLFKAWAADKDAEALRCQKLLFEEEEAAKKKQSDLLERKKVKKLRQKEKKARRQSNEEKGNLEVAADCFEVSSPEVSSIPAPSDSYSNNPDVSPNIPTCLDSLELVQHSSNEGKGNLEVPADCFEVLSAEVSSLPAPSDSCSNNPDVSLDISTRLGLVQPSSNEDTGVESQLDQQLDLTEVQNVGHQPVSLNSQRRVPSAQWQAPKSERFGRNRFHNNQIHQALKAEPIQKYKDSGGPVNSSKIWTSKVRAESGTSIMQEVVPKEAIDQKQSNCEMMMGSISIPVKDRSTHQHENCPAEARDALQIRSDRAAAKIWRPVKHEVGRQDPEEGVGSSKLDDRTSSNKNCLESCPVDSSSSHKSSHVPDGNVYYGLESASIAARAFLAQRWREANAGEHVLLEFSPDTESSSEALPKSDCEEHGGVLARADDQLAKNGGLNSSSSGNIEVMSRPKPEKGIKTKYILKQKNHH